ncbi:MAG: MFS transporter [Dehalococcoidia bacterium]|nr:MFS transporter [Dehalococcoidia bacterium]
MTFSPPAFVASPPRIVWTARLIVFIAFIDLFAQFPIVAPFVASRFDAGPLLVGLAIGAYSLANLFGSLGVGLLLDSWGRKPSIVLGLLGAAAALVSYTIVPAAELFVAARVIHGLAAAFLLPGALAIQADVSPPWERAKAFGAAGSVIAFSAILGPMIGGIGGSTIGPAAVFLTIAAVLTITAGFVALFATETLRKDHSVKSGLAGNPLPLFRKRFALIAYSGAFALNVGLLTLITHKPLWMAAHGETAVWVRGATLSVYAVFALIMLLGPAAKLADRFGRGKPLAGGLGLLGVGLIGLSVSPLTPVYVGMVFVSMAVMGAGYGILFPAGTALLVDATTLRERGTAFGVYSTIDSIGGVVGSGLSGALATALGGVDTPAPFLASSAFALVFAAIALTVPSNTRQLNPPPFPVAASPDFGPPPLPVDR